MDPDANGDGIPDCRRDDDLHYKLVRSPSGLIKKVLRIRKPTQEEQHLTFMVNEAKRKLIKVRAMMNSPPPRRPLQTVPVTTPSPTQSDNEEEGEEELDEEPLIQVQPNNPKIVVPAAGKKQDTKQAATLKKSIPAKTKSKGPNPPMQNRKLAEFTAVDSEELNFEDDGELEEGEQEEEEGNIKMEQKLPSGGSFLLPGAAGAETPVNKKPTPVKPKKEAEVKKPKPSVTAQAPKVSNLCNNSFWLNPLLLHTFLLLPPPQIAISPKYVFSLQGNVLIPKSKRLRSDQKIPVLLFREQL